MLASGTPAAGLVSEAELDELEQQCAAMDGAAASHDLDGYLQSNWRFHRVIYGASRLELLMAMIEGLWLRVGPFIRLALPRLGHLQHSMSCHWTALAALQHRDAAAARAAISDDPSSAADDPGGLQVDRQAPVGGEANERERR